MMFINVIVCTLLLSPALGGPVGEDGNIGRNEDLEERLLAQLIGAKRETQLAKEERDETGGKEVETVQKIDADKTKIDIKLDDKLIEQHLLDCNKRIEIIVMNDDQKGNKACYVHRMEDSAYASLCEGKERKVRVYNIGNQVEDTNFLSDNGPDSVCKSRPMFLITPDEDQNQGGSSRRELQGNKRGCNYSCGIKCSGWNCNWGCDLVC